MRRLTKPLRFKLDAKTHPARSISDLFIGERGGELKLITGPPWASHTARADGLTMVDGLWVSAATKATYVGTVLTADAGKTAMETGSKSAAGGANNLLGLWNAYHRTKTAALNIERHAFWTRSAFEIHPLNGSVGNRITWIDGLGESSITASLQATASGGADSLALVSLALDGIAHHGAVQARCGMGKTVSSVTVSDRFRALGAHYVQAIEQLFVSSPVTFFGGGAEALALELEM